MTDWPDRFMKVVGCRRIHFSPQMLPSSMPPLNLDLTPVSWWRCASSLRTTKPIL